MISLRIWQITYFGDNFSDEFGIKSVTTLSNQFGDKSGEKYYIDMLSFDQNHM